MRTLSEQFLAEVEAFLAASRMKPTDFGREAVGDPSFITHLRRGRSPSLATADKVRVFIRRLEAEAAGRRARRASP
ncbi:hypothetical protein GCM10011504_47510 [Siccirubricoccus deserti]|nr:hypothetical protein GCM10011504_47510 [Siccirubricoccus deserti]